MRLKNLPAKDFQLAIVDLVSRGEVVISEHGYEELTADDIAVRSVIQSIGSSQIVEYYPEYHKGPCVLLLQRLADGDPVHVLWGVPAGAAVPAVLITAYKPDVERWNQDFLRRKRL